LGFLRRGEKKSPEIQTGPLFTWSRSYAPFGHYMGLYKASLNGSFMENFMTLNIINFVDMTRKENDGVSWDVRRVLSP